MVKRDRQNRASFETRLREGFKKDYDNRRKGVPVKELDKKVEIIPSNDFDEVRQPEEGSDEEDEDEQESEDEHQKELGGSGNENGSNDTSETSEDDDDDDGDDYRKKGRCKWYKIDNVNSRFWRMNSEILMNG